MLLTHLSVTEQPYKIPYYAALLRLLHDRPVADAAPGSPSLGKQVLEDFWKGFQAFLDKQAWRETRLCVRVSKPSRSPGLNANLNRSNSSRT